MNDNQHTTRLHVSSAGAEDTSVVRFSLPSGVSNVESVKIMEAEIVNALTPIHDGNDTVYFNEFECKVTYKNNSNTGTKLFGVTLPTLTFTSRMFEARIPHQSYSLDAQLSATEKAMNTPRAVYSSLSENLHTVNPQNTYTVMRQPGSNSLRPLITAVTSASGDYSTHTQVQYAGPSSAFAVRRGNMPLLALKSTNAIWNPYGADIAVDNTDYSSDKFDQPWHCSPFRVIIDLGKDHRFIPGDPVALAFDALAGTAATISSITASTNSFTLDAIGDLTLGDTVKYNSTGAAINGLTNNVLYEIASVSGNIVTLTNVTTDAARPEGSHTLTPIVRPITLTPMTGAGRAYSAACADNFHFLQYGSQILFTNKQDNTTTMTTKSVIVEDPQVDGIVPRIGFLGPVGLTNPGRIIWTIPSATPEEHHVGHSCVFATEDMDITQGARVVMLELEAVGIGPIGNLHVTGCDKVFFGRAQLKSGYLALMLTDQDGYVGQYDFDNYVSPREMIVRLYTEAGRPYNTHGTHNSYLFEFKTVGSHSGCVRVL